MTGIKRNEIVMAWALLVALTGVSWWLGADHGGAATATATTVILVVSLVKVMVIGHSFMELGHAARLLQILFFGLATICVTLPGIYLTVG